MDKALDEFYEDSSKASGRSSWCKECQKERSKLTREMTDPEESKQYFKEYYHANKDKFKARNLQRLYGLTVQQYNQLLVAQDNKCKSCKNIFIGKIHLDHDHSCCPTITTCGKCIRGLLCPGCNRALGFLNDDPEKILRLYEYLIQSKKEE